MKKGEKEYSSQQLSVGAVRDIVTDFSTEYTNRTPKRIKIIDLFCVFLLSVTAVQFVYYMLVGNFPMNSLLSGLFAPFGTFICTGTLLHRHFPVLISSV